MFTRTKKNFNDIIGTLVYCSPEVLSNDYNEMCDIWSCGVLMYCLLSGFFPFEGEDEEEITKKILSGKFEFDVEHFNSISDEAKDLISKCLKYEPRKRITIQEAINHRFFDDLKEATEFTEEDKKKLTNLKKLNKHSKFYQIVLTYLSYNFSDNKLLNELSQLYDKLDKNSDYKITKAELYKAYKEAEIPVTSEELDGVIKSIDFDNNGNVDYEEFIRMCIPKERLFTEANLENAFSLFDKEKKGFITPAEIIDFIHAKKTVKNDDFEQKIKNEILDIADEIIDVEEFKAMMLTMANSD
jgi:calcium-dependent protein kinase